ncbi:MAG: hypothetical protein JGK01_23760 [Microcoleus sp. PH2017_03_ELD_O_A]|uniref:hypothetical protein n=1 Tax=unclassified Microcoleus TaxID=2642155 RepID=UPI001DF3AD6B|nr:MULTISPECIES: hypothetical protein [unclassified Microcoleus]MCC3444651.1 hypothetical protein [Microcoleus sp. PH2017_03_ELD_O_A]MCC3547760.1 hypothetical protein [Microcoleus sp. PH2017_24_DOB_U_A]MCC3569718.1 hypothetical protein [Microcoleus sp. PH2017_31_RDM_U_A]
MPCGGLIIKEEGDWEIGRGGKIFLLPSSLFPLKTVNCQLSTVNSSFFPLPSENCQLSTVNCQLSTLPS